MTKFTIASTALALVLAAPLSAQTADETSGFAYHPTGQELRASKFIGARVYAEKTAEEAAEAAPAPEQAANADPRDAYDDIGEIGDVLMSQEGEVEAVLVDVGGFLGMGEKEVALTMDKLVVMPGGDGPDDWFLVSAASPETLENAPVFEEPEQSSALNAAESWTAEKTADGKAMLESAGDQAATMANSAANSVESGMNRAGEAIAGAAASAGAGMEHAGQAMSDKAADLTTGDTPDYVTADVGSVTSEELTGARVYDQDDKRIGEVHAVEMSSDGQVDKAIVDVGGFLGIGEKRVELGFDQMNIEKLTGGDELRIQVKATKDQLMEMPAYEG